MSSSMTNTKLLRFYVVDCDDWVKFILFWNEATIELDVNVADNLYHNRVEPRAVQPDAATLLLSRAGL